MCKKVPWKNLTSLCAAVGAAAFLYGSPAFACKPGEIKYTTLAPVSVRVPVGGTATVRGIVRCGVDSDDYTDDSTLTRGGAIQFDVRLVDEEGIDDLMGTAQFKITFRNRIPGGTFARVVQKSLSWSVRCPAADLEIVGTEDSGEGEPGCSDPADLALEIDHGDSTESGNHYPGNLFGNPGAENTVPACCVQLTDEDANSVSGTRTSYLLLGNELRNACAEDAIAPALKQQIGGVCIGNECDCGFGGRYFWGPFDGSLDAILNPHTCCFNPRRKFAMELERLESSENALGAGPVRQEGLIFVVFHMTAPLLDVNGFVQPDGSFDLRGRGTIAGFPNIDVQYRGTFTAGSVEGEYIVDTTGKLPGGVPGRFQITGEGQDWDEFWVRAADPIRAAAEAIAMLNFRAPLGGVDFSEAASNMAGGLLELEASFRFDEPVEVDDAAAPLSAEGEPVEQSLLPEPGLDALRTIQGELEGLADAVAASTLVSRVPTEAELRGTAALFEEAGNQRETMNTLRLAAPGGALVTAVNAMLRAIADAGDSIQAVAVLALGGAFTTVSAADFAGPATSSDAIVSGFGENLADALEVAAAVPLPTTLSGRSIRVTDSEGAESLADLFFGSQGQFNYHLPAGLAAGPAVVTVFSGDQVIATGRVVIQQTAPSLFTANANGAGVAAAGILRVKADGSRTNELAFTDAPTGSRAATPIDLGPEGEQVFLLLFGTGIRGASKVRVLIGGEEVEVLGFAPSPEFVGLDQVNVRLPRSLIGRGELNIELFADDLPANVARVAIQ